MKKDEFIKFCTDRGEEFRDCLGIFNNGFDPVYLIWAVIATVVAVGLFVHNQFN